MSTATTRRSRTIWIWILIVLAVLAGLVALADAARYMGWLPIAALGELKFFIPAAYWLGALLSAGLALIWFWVAKRLYDLDPRGWLFVVIIAIVNLIFLLMAIIGQSTFQSVMWAILLNALALIIGVLPSTRAAFGQT